MLTQLFKIMWHRKGKNFLLLIEIFFSFIVLFATSTLVIESLRNYFTPVGFDYEDVYVLSLEHHGEQGASALEKMKQIKRVVDEMPEIASSSFSYSNLPFSYSGRDQTITAGDFSADAYHYYVEPAYFEAMDLELKAGRWLANGDIGSITPVVINEEMSRRFFRGENPVGKRITAGHEQLPMEVVGVIRYYRQDGEFASPSMNFFQIFNLADTASSPPTDIIMEVKAGLSPMWQSVLVEKVNQLAGEWSVEIDSLTENRADKAKSTLLPIIALSIVCGFLIFNVALGLFGVLWQNINKRYSEIGIRRALGSTKRLIRLQMMGEVLMLATMGLIAGLVLAIQFPLLGVFNVETNIYLLAIALSLLSIYLLVAFCAWYPSRQASGIEPAEALHYE